MSSPLDAEQFAAALNSERGLSPPISAEGFVRKTDDKAVIEFSPSIRMCLTWIKIPLKMIDKVQPLGKRPCLNHLHDYVILHFKLPESPDAQVFAQLLSQHESAPTKPAMVPVQQGSLPGLTQMPNIGRMPPDVPAQPSVQTAAAFYQICYYEANGQYAGTDTTYDANVATARIQNWSVYGKYCRWYYTSTLLYCPPH